MPAAAPRRLDPRMLLVGSAILLASQTTSCIVSIDPPPEGAYHTPEPGRSDSGPSPGDAASPDAGDDTGPPPPDSCGEGWSSRTDHGGESLRIDGTEVWEGCHHGLQRIEIGNRASVRVAAFDGEGKGRLRIVASDIVVRGRIDAAGRGFGGGGGGGGDWYDHIIGCPETADTLATRGLGGRPDGPPGGTRGQAAVGVRDGPDADEVPLCAGNGGAGGGRGGSAGEDAGRSLDDPAGAGGPGAGPQGGAGGLPGTSSLPGERPGAGGPGRPGGYRGVASNGDSSTDASVSMGSGGGGGGGGRASHPGGCRGAGAGGAGSTPGGAAPTEGCAAGGGGGGGAAGGGSVELVGTVSVELGPQAEISASGAGDPAAGSGHGAGGGILLQAPSVRVARGAAVVSLGGGAQATNGGTIKVLADERSLVEEDLQGGRLRVAPLR